jgi:hypothetical protein
MSPDKLPALVRVPRRPIEVRVGLNTTLVEVEALVERADRTTVTRPGEETTVLV